MTEKANEAPKIHIDSDWKAEAQAEKQRLSEETKDSGDAGDRSAGHGEIPPANFQTLVSTMLSQALLYMGGIPDPMSGQRMLHLDLAKHHIDLLGVLEEKTKGNLADEESKALTQVLNELRLSYLQLSKQVAEHLAKQGTSPQAGAAAPPPGPIIQEP